MSPTLLLSTANSTPACVADAAKSCGRARQWELVEFAARGSLARIYRARPVGTPPDRPAAYALKMLRPCWQDDPEAIRLLQREAAAAQSVSHPHLISVLTSFVAEPPRMLVMPWLDGASIRARLDARQQFNVPKTLWIARQTAEALNALHAAGWMHGDITPANIHVSPTGHVTLLDLSFARRREEIGSAVDRPIMGTCSYIAPEYFTSALRPDCRSDIYSLGAVMFEMFSGRVPHHGRSLEEMAIAYRQSKPADLARLAPHVPREAIRLVQRMTTHDPIRRPSSEELCDRLLSLEIAAFSQWAG